MGKLRQSIRALQNYPSFQTNPAGHHCVLVPWSLSSQLHGLCLLQVWRKWARSGRSIQAGQSKWSMTVEHRRKLGRQKQISILLQPLLPLSVPPIPPQQDEHKTRPQDNSSDHITEDYNEFHMWGRVGWYTHGHHGNGVTSETTVNAVLSFHLYVGSRDQTGCQTCSASTLPTATSRRPTYYCGKDIQTRISLSSQKLFAIDIPAGEGKISLLHEPFLGIPTILQIPCQGAVVANTKQTPGFVVELFSPVLLIYF